MSKEQDRKLPYQSLGSRLKRLRQKQQESLAEVSGAVEIDESDLRHFEQGEKRPSEDILMLLINHFNIKPDEAETLWQLAGYEQPGDNPNMSHDSDSNQISSVFVMPMDVRVAYTDMVHLTANQYGLIVNFMQSLGPNNQPLVVSRLGMSKEHAQSIIDMLQEALKESEPKSLPSPKQTKRPRRSPKQSDKNQN